MPKETKEFLGHLSVNTLMWIIDQLAADLDTLRKYLMRGLITNDEYRVRYHLNTQYHLGVLSIAANKLA